MTGRQPELGNIAALAGQSYVRLLQVRQLLRKRMANTSNLLLLRYLTPFLLNGISLLAMYLYGNHTKTNQYAAAVYLIIFMLAVLIVNIIFLFVFIKRNIIRLQ